MAQIIVARSFNQAVNETVQKRIFVGENDVLVNPSLTPLLTLVTKIGNRKKSVSSTRVEWIEDDFAGVWGVVSNGTTDYSSVATTIAVADGTLFSVGDLVAIPKAASSSAAEEIVRVTVIATNTLTIVRGIGGAGADTIGATVDIRIVSSAYAEGAAFGVDRSVTKAVKISYTQIFRRPVKVTKTMAAQSQFGPSNERVYQRKKKLEELRREMESAGLWSRASESLASPATIRTTMGLKSRIVTNVYNANTTLTESAFLSFAEQAFSTYYEGQEKLLLAAPKVISAMDFFADGKLKLEPEANVYGVKLQRYVTSHGTFMISRDLMLQNSPNTALGAGHEAFALDVDSIEFAPLSGNGENRDTQLLTDVVKDGSDVYADEYICEGAWVVRHEARHARLYNCSAFS